MARRVEALVPGSYRRLAKLALVSFAGGLIEAALLVLLARIAAASADDQDRIELIPRLADQVTIAQALLVALALLAGKLLVGTLVARGSASLAAYGLTEVRLQILRSFVDASWPVQSAERQGSLQELMTTHVNRTASVNLSLALMITAALNMAVLVATALLVNPLTALMLMFTGGLLALGMRPLAAAVRRTAARTAESGHRFASAVTELVGISRELRVFGTGDEALAKIEPLNARQARNYRRSRTLLLMAPQVYQTSGLLVLIAGIGVVSLTSTSGLAGIGAVVLLLLRALSYGQQDQTAYQSLNEAVPYLDQIREQRNRYRARPATGGHRQVTSIGGLELDRIGYEYLPGRPVLHEVSGTIEPGEAVGIIGPSGSGKSTLLQLLLRLRDPTSGALRVDGVDARDLELEGWYQRVAFVPQDPHLVEGTVAENIAFFRDIPDETVRKVAEMAHLSAEIEALPHGYDEVIGPEDTTLSGGQQQRLTIARALAGQPDLLVLDEPTSALDMRSEARLQQTLRTVRGQVTLLVVAHRLSTIGECDRIMVLSGGTVQGFDRHEELVSTSRFYEEALELSVLQHAPGGASA
ncbi:MAG: ABC transporter ATP-binding protein [Acidimicrobiales bacterium]